jgi:hypothetical protein
MGAAGHPDEGPFSGGSPDEPGGPPARRLREQLEREFGEVPPESPSEPAKTESEDDEDGKEGLPASE